MAHSMKLSSGYDMPILGLGTWKSKAGEVENSVRVALEAGYTHIDCAMIYGNESEVGSAFKEVFSTGKIKRKDIFITSKLWNTCHASSDVKPSLQESLARLKLDYLDLYLIHWPTALKPGKDNFPLDEEGNMLYVDIPPLETWTAMEKCVDEGLVKSIGLSNFNSQQIQNILDNCRIKPAVLQVEIHPYLSQEKLVKFCQDRGIAVTAYSPLGSPDRPGANPDEPILLEDSKLKAVAAKYKKSAAQVVMKWLLQRDIIIIPKSVTPSRILENQQLFDFELSTEDMGVISSFNINERLIALYVQKDGKKVFRDSAAPNFPFHQEF